MTQMGPFIHLERIIAGRLGMSRNQIREARKNHLEKNVHWAIGAGRNVMLSDLGLQRLADLGDLPPPSSVPAAPPENVAPGASSALQVGAFVAFTTLRNYPRGNRRFVDARPTGLDPATPVWRVKIHPDACEQFTPGMQFEAVYVRHLLAECRRRPRRKGRW